MARDHGRILSAIWSDHDFLALSQQEQRFYMFLLSQANLNQAGVLPVTVRRWSFSAADLTAAGVEELLTELDRQRFVVWDRDTEELLIRTYVRNDKVYRQPKVMLALVADAAEIVSSRLRLALLAELDRLPIEEVSATPPPKGGQSARQVVDGCLETLRRTLFVPDNSPPPRHRETLPERVRETLPETHTDTAAQEVLKPSDTPGKNDSKRSNDPNTVDNRETAGQDFSGKGIGNPSGNPHAGGRAHSPAPAPAPAPTKELSLNSASQPPLLALVPDEPLAPLAERPSDLFDEFWSVYPRHVGKARAKTTFATKVKHGADAQAVIAAARSYADRCRTTKQDPQFIPHPTTWLNRESWTDDLDASLPLPQATTGGYQPYRNPEDHSGYYGAI